MSKLLSKINDPRIQMYTHLGFMVFWAVLWIVAALAGWLKSVVFVSHLSAAALVLSSWAAFQGAHSEVGEKESD